MPIGSPSGNRKDNYKWRERKTINAGSNTMTLSTIIPSGAMLRIF